MSNSIAPGSSADVNVRVTALTTNPNVPAQYKTIILKKNLVNGVNTLTQEMISAQNTKYVIKYDYVLGENITVPKNCILEFDGGSLSNGIVIGQKTVLKGKVAIENYDGVFINEKGIPLDERLDEFLVDISIIEAYDSADFNDYNNESHYIANINQSMAYWNGYFILLNVNSSNKPVAYISDSEFQPLYSTKLNITSHCNGCTVKDNTLYIGGSTTDPNYYFDIPTILNNAINHNSTDPVGTFLNNIGVYGISWNERSREFCARLGTAFCIYDENWNELRRYSSIYNTFVPDYLIQGVEGQTDLFYDGYFVYEGIIMGACMTMFVIIDLDKNAIIYSKSLPSRAEIEGIVKVGKHTYCSCNCYGFFSIWGINSTTKSRLSCIQQGDVSYDVGKTILYVNNTYSGESYGSSDKPFTRLSQALFVAYSQPVKYIALVNTGKPYWINQSININAYLYIYTTGGNNNNNKADVILSFTAYSSFVRIENINLKLINSIVLQGSNLQIYNSTIDGGMLSRVIGAFYSDCTIGLYNSTINCANNSAKMIIYQRCLLNFYIDYNSVISGNCLFERSTDGVCHFNVIMHKSNHSLPTVNATKMVIDADGANNFEVFLNTFSNNNLSKGLLWFISLPPANSSEYRLVINALITGNTGDNYGLSYNRGVFYFDKAASGVVLNTMSYPILRNTTVNYNTLYPLNNTSLDLDTDLGKLLNALISYYFNQTVVKSGNSCVYVKRSGNTINMIDADGLSYDRKSGTSDQRPNQLLNTDVGYIYFDTTLGKPIYWTGSGWVDATGATV